MSLKTASDTLHPVDLLERLKSAPPTEAIKEAKLAQAEFFRHSLYLLAKHLLGYKDINWRTHGRAIRALESPKPRKLVVMPRGSFKSSLGSVAYPIFRLLKNPNERILLDSELYTNSKNLLREIKLHLEKERLCEIYGEFKTKIIWNEGEIVIAQRTKILKEASITCTGIGAEKTGQHYDTIIMDDMNSPSNSGTPEGCQKVIDHYKYMNAILEPHGTLVIIGTRYGALDLIQHVIDTEIFGGESNP